MSERAEFCPLTRATVRAVEVHRRVAGAHDEVVIGELVAVEAIMSATI